MEDKRNEFFAEVNKVNSFIYNKVEDYMVVGSGALFACGIPLAHVPHDIDLEVICSDAQWKVFEALADSCGNGFHKNKEKNCVLKNYWENKPCIFTIKPQNSDKKILINIWRVKKFTHSCLYYNCVKYSTVESTLKIKMQYGRRKDWRDLTYIIKNLTLLAEQCDKEGDGKEVY